MREMRAIMRSEAKIILRDPMAGGILFALPFVMIALTYRVFAEMAGPNASSVLAAPAYGSAFGFLINTWVIYSFFKEHGWGTWPRILASGTSIWKIVSAKLIPYVLLGSLQSTIVVIISLTFFHYSFTRFSTVLLALAGFPFATTAVGTGFVLAAFTRNHFQAAMFGNLVAFCSAALGGAVFPPNLLPDWAVPISPFTPHYWVMRGYSIILFSNNYSELWLPVIVLLGLGLGLLAAAALRFRASEVKQFAY